MCCITSVSVAKTEQHDQRFSYYAYQVLLMFDSKEMEIPSKERKLVLEIANSLLHVFKDGSIGERNAFISLLFFFRNKYSFLLIRTRK